MKWYKLYRESTDQEIVYYSKIECEHEGDIRNEVDDLEEAGAKVVDIQTTGSGMDKDYWATIYFKITNPKLFEDEICPINKLPVKNW